VGVYVIEIGLPFLFFLPSRRVRLAAGVSQVALMVCVQGVCRVGVALAPNPSGFPSGHDLPHRQLQLF
jgi:hypothetical protein